MMVSPRGRRWPKCSSQMAGMLSGKTGGVERSLARVDVGVAEEEVDVRVKGGISKSALIEVVEEVKYGISWPRPGP